MDADVVPLRAFSCGTTRDVRIVERAKGVEPSSLAWEARVMPLYDARKIENKFYHRDTSVVAPNDRAPQRKSQIQFPCPCVSFGNHVQ